MGWGEPENYPATSEHGRISTPNLVEFGKTGIQFTNAYAGYTVCAPSRTTLMTGFHSGHFPREKLAGTVIPRTQNILTTQEMLQKAGYVTAGIGKMAPLASPTEQGFDHFIGQVDQGLCHNMYPRKIDTGNGTQNLNLSLNWAIPSTPTDARTACMANPDKFNFTVDITHQHSMSWLEAHVSQQKKCTQAGQARVPFYLYEAFTVPHAGGWGHAPTQPESGAPVPTDGQYANHTTWPTVERDHAVQSLCKTRER
jgi:arylsulfatase A-like enzyme